MKHYYSPLECYLEIYGARQIVKHARKHAAHREDQIQAEADLVHYQNALKETTGIPGEVDSNSSSFAYMASMGSIFASVWSSSSWHLCR